MVTHAGFYLFMLLLMTHRILLCLFFVMALYISEAQVYTDSVTYDTTYVAKKELPEIDYTHPQYKNGVKDVQVYLNKALYNTEKPDSDSTKQIFLKVHLDEKGIITKVNLLRGVNEHINAIVTETILYMPAWQPAISSGEPVSSDRAIRLDVWPSLLSADH